MNIRHWMPLPKAVKEIFFMKHTYLKTVQCPCCQKYYIIRCSHAESGSEGDEAIIQFKSDEYFEIMVLDESPH